MLDAIQFHTPAQKWGGYRAQAPHGLLAGTTGSAPDSCKDGDAYETLRYSRGMQQAILARGTELPAEPSGGGCIYSRGSQTTSLTATMGRLDRVRVGRLREGDGRAFRAGAQERGLMD